MKKVGITGGIGSGKTLVCRVFETLGVPVFYADTEAKKVMTTDLILMDEIKQLFGEESYDNEGRLNRHYLASIVFENEAKLVQLNKLVHPAVFRAFDQWLTETPPGVPYVLKEAALLFESGSYLQCDFNLLVTAPEDVRISRVRKRDGFSEEQVRARMAKQWKEEEKEKLANGFIRNVEGQSIIRQVLYFHEQFKKN